MKNLTNTYLIDIGNTRIKYVQATQLTNIFFTEHLNLNQLFAHLKNAQNIIITAGRSANAQKALGDIYQFAQKNNIEVHNACINNKLLAVNYTDSSQFGVDRYLNLLGARKHLKENFCVVSAGTAITLDFYTNCHIGGMILLGLGSAKTLLAEKAGLPHITYPTKLLGNDTASCIGAGIYLGYQNLITKTIESIETEQKTQFSVIFTGGDADILCQNQPVIPELLFEGMLEWYAQKI